MLCVQNHSQVGVVLEGVGGVGVGDCRSCGVGGCRSCGVGGDGESGEVGVSVMLYEVWFDIEVEKLYFRIKL